jgi:O-antigen ligase
MAAVAAFVMAGALVMTLSRSGAGAMAAGIVMMSLAARRRFASSRAGWVALGSLTMVFVAVVSLAGAELGARVVGRLDAVELRRNIWADSAVTLRDFPLTGTGLNTFGTAMITYQTSRQDQHYQEAHNDYLQLLVEGGVLVGVPVLAAIILAVRAVRRRFVVAEDDALTYWIRTGAATGLVAIALQSTVEFSLQMPGNAVVFVVLLAVAMHGDGRRVPRAPVTVESTS